MKKIIVGLGNPGPRYVFTRHNVGFLAIDQYVENNQFLNFKKTSGKTFEALEANDFILVKPMTYMNLSGQIFPELFKKYGMTDPENIIVIYDDVSLDFGKIRIRPSGSAGGHNGIKNIIKILGTKNFPRIRIGIDKKPDYMDLADYVLSKFSKEQMYNLYKILDEVSKAIDMIIKGNIEKSMNKYNGDLLL
jgi:PTH1 family peptidyl-tRNA hydrolase